MKKLITFLTFLLVISQVQAQLPRVIILATGELLPEQELLLTGPVIPLVKYLLMT
jgi:hypothetical protein